MKDTIYKLNKVRLKIFGLLMLLMLLGGTLIFHSAQPVSAITWNDKTNEDVDWAPYKTDNTYLKSVTGGTYWGTKVDGGETYTWYSGTNHTATYANVGYWNGLPVDMHIKTSNAKGVTRIRWSPKGIAFATGGKSDYYQPMSIDTEVWFSSQGKKINFGDVVLGLGFMDLEPNYLYTDDGAKHNSFDQPVRVHTNTALVHSGGYFNPNSRLDKNKVINSHTFQVATGARFPTYMVGNGGNLKTEYAGYSSGVLLYKEKVGSNLKFTFSGKSYDDDLLVLNGMQIRGTGTPAVQPAPEKEQDVGNGLTNKEQAMKTTKITYKITQVIKQDYTVNGTGFVIEDNVPAGITIDKVTNPSSGMWTYAKTGNKVTFTASKDVYKSPGTYTFTIEGTIQAGQTGPFSNTAASTPIGKSKMNSNTVKATVPVVAQNAPVKAQDVGGGFTTAEQTLQNQTFTYRITQEVKQDDFVNGTNFKVEDTLPNDLTIASVTSSDTSVFTPSFSGNTATFNAKVDVYKKPGTYTFTINAKYKDAATSTSFTNQAITTPKRGGKLYSNVVTTRVPNVTKTINYLDFDGYETKVKNADTVTMRPWESKDYTIPTSITYNSKDYKSVTGQTDGNEKDHGVLTLRGSDATATYNYYYRTKWKYYVIHQKQGSTPALNAPSMHTTLEDQDMLRQENFEVYLKSNDGKTINKYDASGQPYTGRYSNSGVWFPTDTGQTFDKQRNDTQIIRINYKQHTATPVVDYIQLDTVQASTGKIPLQAQFNVSGLPASPLLNTQGLTGTRLTSADIVNAKYDAYLLALNLDVSAKNEKTSTNNVYTYKTKLYKKEGSKVVQVGPIKVTGHLTDTNLVKNTRQDILFNIKLTEDLTVDTEQNYFNKETTSPRTNIHTATERQLKNSDLDANGVLVYNAQVRTVWTPTRLMPYNETIKLGLKTEGKTKSGYYDDIEIPITYETDVEETKGTAPNLNVQVPTEITKGYVEDAKKYITTYDQTYMDFKDNYTTLATTKTTQQTTPRYPMITPLLNWKGSKDTITLKYEPYRFEARTGVAISERKFASLDTALTPTKQSNWLKSTNKLPLPIWLKPAKYTFNLNNTNLGGTRQSIGTNKVDINFTREIEVVAQMYADESSKTKQLDELYVQPVFADKDYKKLSDLTSKGRTWITSITTQNGVNE